MTLTKSILSKGLPALLIALALFPETIQAQACSAFYPMKEGIRMEYTLYGKNDKVEGSQWQEFRNVSQSGDGLQAEVHLGFTDAKGKNPFETSYKMSCDGNVIRIDYESLLSGAMMEQFGDAEAEITGTDIEIPNNLEAGMELPDASVAMKISMGAMNMNMEVDMTGRKVEKVESVTVPAGTFECYVLYSDNHSKMMMANQNFPTRTWLAEGVGVVKTESYNNKGKTTSTMVLASITDSGQ